MTNDKTRPEPVEGLKMSNEGKSQSEEKELLQQENTLLDKLNDRVGKLADAIERTRIDEYTSMITRPWKFFFINFAAGIFRGLGMAVGFTIIAAIFLYVLVQLLRNMVDLPIVGAYIAEIVRFVNQYLNQGLPAQ
ncbi:MAG: hypothetical protein KKA31_02070 [Candidatus Margulisbacteria bacterium]|nr:hypothetical protein [Candidatus Margulisiibacteriota bacterium]